MSDSKDAGKSSSPPESGGVVSVPVYASGDLFGAGREIEIRHDGALYRLRITRMGKLILTK